LQNEDKLSGEIHEKQQSALQNIPHEIADYPTFTVPLRSYNISNIANIRRLLYEDNVELMDGYRPMSSEKGLEDLIDDLYTSGKRVIFTMGKGGVGKTTLATDIALGLSARGAKVHLTTTDPANHLNYDLATEAGISVSHIDEAAELENTRMRYAAKQHPP